MEQFSRLGASPNAFTSNAMTGYYFESTEKFEENLRILLSFVSIPYFTKESVEKEQGIIGQEIRMIEDEPEWRVYMALVESLFSASAPKSIVIRKPRARNIVTMQAP